MFNYTLRTILYWGALMSGRFEQDYSSMSDQEFMEGISDTLRSHSFSSSPELSPRFKEYLTRNIPEQIDRKIDPLKEYPLLK